MHTLHIHIWRALVVGLIGAIVASTSMVGAQESELATECDRLAASPLDSSRPSAVAGVAFDAMDAEAAIAACSTAVATQPDNARLHFQYGRALQKGEQGREALLAYKKAIDLGSYWAANNLGVVLRFGVPGVEKNSELALKMFKLAALRGVDMARRSAAEMLDAGEGVPAPSPEEAAIYWRVLADGGDAEAAEKVGVSIKQGNIIPQSETELADRLRMAADQGRVNAAIEYANWLKTNGEGPEGIALGARYALLGYRMALAAAPESEAGWPVYQWGAFRSYQHFIEAGAENTMSSEEYEQGRSDFGSDGVKFTVEVDCGGSNAPVEIYLWQWERDYPQTDDQAEWYRQARGCTIPENVTDSFRKLFAIAVENETSFPELAKYALANAEGAADQAGRVDKAEQVDCELESGVLYVVVDYRDKTRDKERTLDSTIMDFKHVIEKASESYAEKFKGLVQDFVDWAFRSSGGLSYSPKDAMEASFVQCCLRTDGKGLGCRD